MGQYVKQTHGAVGHKTFQYWWKFVHGHTSLLLVQIPGIYQSNFSKHREQRFKFCNPKILYILPAESFVRLQKDFCINSGVFWSCANTICILYYQKQTISTILFHIFPASKRLLYQPGELLWCILKLWQTQSVFSGWGISPSNDFNLGYKLTGGRAKPGSQWYWQTPRFSNMPIQSQHSHILFNCSCKY